MKKYIFTFCILSVFFTSCIWERGDKDRRPTQRGKEIHECWFNITDYVLKSPVQTAFYLNAWLAADSLGRIEIEDKYFPNERIRVDENGNYLIYKGEQLQKSINTHQTLLSDMGSAWEVLSYVDDDYLMGKYGFQYGSLNVSCVEAGCWEITSDLFVSPELESHPMAGDTVSWNLRLTATATPVKLNESGYKLEGAGIYWLGYALLNYQIDTPIQQAANEWGAIDWTGGKVRLTARMEEREDIQVGAEYIGNGQVRIDYKGIKEAWDLE